jgi:putative ABC transport system permease protein
VSRLPGVASAAGSDTTVSGGGYFGVMFQTEGGPDVKTTRGMTIDENFVNTLGLTVTRGRGFSREFNDSRSVLFNEAAVRQFGWTDPVGMKIRRLGGEDEPTGEYTIVGIVRDLNYNSLHSPINSFIYFCFDRENRVFGNLNVRLKPGNTAATVSAIENVWKSFGTAEPFRYDFMEDRLDALYGNERTSGRIFTVFSLLAVVIACIGLFGLSAYTTGMRTKEIGIRKTLGSSPARIGAMLSGDFAKLVLLAIVIGFPVAYYAMSRWLQNFAFRTAISFWIFLVAGGTALAIQQLTTSYQAFKAARTNPADALRFE